MGEEYSNDPVSRTDCGANILNPSDNILLQSFMTGHAVERILSSLLHVVNWGCPIPHVSTAKDQAWTDVQDITKIRSRKTKGVQAIIENFLLRDCDNVSGDGYVDRAATKDDQGMGRTLCFGRYSG